VPVIVAIPACNEQQGMAACLAAVDTAAACTADDADVTLLILANNCRDRTATMARRGVSRPLRVVVDQVELPADWRAGGVRREALDPAAALLPADGVRMTTDADSTVAPDWIAANLAALASADAVAGVVAFDLAIRAALPWLPGRDLEWRLAELHAQLNSLLGPVTLDPWPNHIWTWGASLALTVSACRAIGGLPAVPLA